MLRVLKWLGLGLLAAIAIVLLLAARRADTFTVSRSRVVAAPAGADLPLIDDLKAFNTWNPFRGWAGDAACLWRSGKWGRGHECVRFQAQAGRERLPFSKAPRGPALRAAMQIDMTAPLAARNDILFSLAPEAGGTRVTWSMTGTRRSWRRWCTRSSTWMRWWAARWKRGLAPLPTGGALMVSARDIVRAAMALEGHGARAPTFDRTGVQGCAHLSMRPMASDKRSLNLRLSPEEQAMKCTCRAGCVCARAERVGGAGGRR